MLGKTLEVKERPCIFLTNCAIGNKDACTANETAGCSQARERQERANQNCPLMVKTGGNNLKCHVPQLLPFLPLKFACHDGDDCVLCKIVPEIVAEVAKHNFEGNRSKMLKEDLEKAGATVIEAVKTRQAKDSEKAGANAKVAV